MDVSQVEALAILVKAVVSVARARPLCVLRVGSLSRCWPPVHNNRKMIFGQVCNIASAYERQGLRVDRAEADRRAPKKKGKAEDNTKCPS